MVTRRLRCPHCHEEFDYDFIPGMSATAFRLGNARYMRCPLCHRFGLFPLTRTRGEGSGARPGATAVAPGGGTGGAQEPPGDHRTAPRFDDRRPLVLWASILLVPAVLLMLSGVLLGRPTTTDLLLVMAGVIVLAIGAVLMIGYSLPRRVR